MFQKKILLTILTAICLSIYAAPKKKKTKKPKPSATSCDGAGAERSAGTEEPSRRSSPDDLPLEVKAQILKIKAAEAEGSPFFFLSDDDLTKYKPLVEAQVNVFFPLGPDRLFQRGGVSTENKGILKANQLSSLCNINNTLKPMITKLEEVINGLGRFTEEDLNDCLFIIKSRFKKLNPKLSFSTNTFKNMKPLNLLFMELIDLTSALSWINKYKQNFLTKDELLNIGIETIVKGVFGFFKIINRDAAQTSIETSLSALTFEVLAGTHPDEGEPELLLTEPSGGGGGPMSKSRQGSKHTEEVPESLKDLLEDIIAFDNGHFNAKKHSLRPTNMILLRELDYHPYTEKIAKLLDISSISKKTAVALCLEIQLKVARILSNFATRIGLKLQGEETKDSTAAQEVFNCYVNLSLKHFSSKKNPVFKYQLELLKRKFGTLEKKNFEFLLDTLRLSPIDMNYLFFLVSRVVIPSEWMQDENTLADTLRIKKLHLFQIEQIRQYEEYVTSKVENIQSPSKKSYPMVKKVKKGPDNISVPTTMAERELSSCESLSSFKITIPSLKLKDLKILPPWMKYIAGYLGYEASFLNNIPSSMKMFTYKYTNLSQEASLSEFAKLCLLYKRFADEQDDLLGVEPGKLSTTRLLAIFSSIKHLIFSRLEIDLSLKMELWSSSMCIPLDFSDIVQIGSWLESIENVDYLDKFFEYSDDDEMPPLEYVESDPDYDPLAGKFLAGLE